MRVQVQIPDLDLLKGNGWVLVLCLVKYSQRILHLAGFVNFSMTGVQFFLSFSSAPSLLINSPQKVQKIRGMVFYPDRWKVGT